MNLLPFLRALLSSLLFDFSCVFWVGSGLLGHWLAWFLCDQEQIQIRSKPNIAATIFSAILFGPFLIVAIAISWFVLEQEKREEAGK